MNGQGDSFSPVTTVLDSEKDRVPDSNSLRVALEIATLVEGEGLSSKDILKRVENALRSSIQPIEKKNEELIRFYIFSGENPVGQGKDYVGLISVESDEVSFKLNEGMTGNAIVSSSLSRTQNLKEDLANLAEIVTRNIYEWKAGRVLDRKEYIYVSLKKAPGLNIYNRDNGASGGYARLSLYRGLEYPFFEGEGPPGGGEGRVEVRPKRKVKPPEYRFWKATPNGLEYDLTPKRSTVTIEANFLIPDESRGGFSWGGYWSLMFKNSLSIRFGGLMHQLSYEQVLSPVPGMEAEGFNLNSNPLIFLVGGGYTLYEASTPTYTTIAVELFPINEGGRLKLEYYPYWLFKGGLVLSYSSFKFDRESAVFEPLTASFTRNELRHSDDFFSIGLLFSL